MGVGGGCADVGGGGRQGVGAREGGGGGRGARARFLGNLLHMICILNICFLSLKDDM